MPPVTFRPLNAFATALRRSVQQRIADELRQPALLPFWAPEVSRETVGGNVLLKRGGLALKQPAELVALVDQPELLLSQPAAEWPSELIALWQLGLVYLADRESQVPDGVHLDGKRIVLKRSRIEPPAWVTGNGVLVVDSVTQPSVSIAGSAAILRSSVARNVELGPHLFMDECDCASFGRIGGYVQLEATMVGSFASVWGAGVHTEMMPFAMDEESRYGARVGPHAWVAQSALVLPGGRVGAGAVVSTGSFVNSDVGDHTVAAGRPARRTPIDILIRDRSPEEAHALGRDQGPAAAALPMFGPPRLGWRSPTVLEIDYREHGLLRGFLQPASVEFHRGILESFFAWLLRGHRAQVSARVAASVRFTVELDRPIVQHAEAAPGLTLRGRDLERADPETPEEAAICEQLASGPMTVERLRQRLLLQALGSVDETLESEDPHQAEFDIENALLRLSSRGLLEPSLLPNMARFGIPPRSRLAPFWRAFERIEETPALEVLSGEAAIPQATTTAAPPLSTPGGDVRARLVLKLKQMVPALSARPEVPGDVTLLRLGLSSISLVEFAVFIEEHFGVSEIDLFENDTVDKLATMIHQEGR